jgi:outer membrane receptor for ferrienterochelin and colicin
MRTYSFIPTLLLCFASATVGALAQTTSAQPTSAPAASSSVTGTVTNASSEGVVAGATVELNGPGTDRKTSSDAHGAFSFDGLSAGTYSLRTTANGYTVSVSPPFSVGVNEHVQLAVALQPQTSTALKTIASVRVNGTAAVNASSAPTVTITNREYVAKGQVLVQQALAQTPGVTVEHYNGGLGSVAVLTIRGAGAFSEGQYANTGYEVLVLQDGEPLRNGQYGDFDLSTLTPAIYSRTEVLKGVGGTSLFGANTIGGTLNLVTRDPMKTEGGEFLGTVGGFGFTDLNISETNTIGKVGYVFDVHRMTSEGPIPGNFLADYVNYCGGNPFANGTCYIAHPTQDFDLKSALAKVRYQFSPVTSLTFTGTFESDMRDQNGLQGNPSSANDGSTVDSRGVPYYFGYPVDNVYNIQPKYAADLHTQLGGGDLILRSYAQLLERVDGDIAPLPTTPLNNPPYPGATLQNYNQYMDRAVDRLYGSEAYWTKIFGRHTITLAAGGNGDSFFEWGGAIPQPMTFSQLPLVVQGKQIERTYMLRDQIEASPKWRFDFAGYYSSYDTLNTKRFDPRLGVVFRPDLASAVHFSVASGFAAPRIRDINLVLDTNSADSSSDPRCPSTNPYCVGSAGNAGLLPERAVGYDLGYQHNFTPDGRGSIDVDFYRTNLYEHIINADLPAPAGTSFSDGTPMLFINTPLNLSRAVYTGLEFTGSLPLTRNFALYGDYDTQAAYPLGIDVFTQTISQTLVNNQQFLGVPVHKMGYGMNYRNSTGTTAFFEGHFNGINNPFNVPSFWVYNAGVSMPLGENALHVTWNNIFNKNATIWSFYNGGVPYPGFSGPFGTNSHPSYPHSFNVTFERRWGSLKTP